MGHLITVRTFNSMYLRAIKKLGAQKIKKTNDKKSI